MKLGLLVSAVCVVGLVGCGGASESDAFNSAAGSSGSAGAMSNGGSAAGDGSGSETTPGGTTGGTTSGKGGTASSAGTPGSGGSGPTTPPDPTVKEHCDAWCDGVVAAKCSNEDPKADCVLGCRALSSSPVCNARYAELFKCAEGATFTCNKEGNAVPTGCEVEQAQVGLCLLSSPDKTIEKPCAAYCKKQEAADCTNSDPAAECTYGCQLASSLVPACVAQWKTFVDCAQDAEVSCSADGDPVPGGCEAKYLLYLACAVAQGQ